MTNELLTDEEIRINDIIRANASCAWDQRREYSSPYEAFGSYYDNVNDALREEGLDNPSDSYTRYRDAFAREVGVDAGKLRKADNAGEAAFNRLVARKA